MAGRMKAWSIPKVIRATKFWNEGYFPEFFLFRPSAGSLPSPTLEGRHLCTLYCYDIDEEVRESYDYRERE